MSVGLQRARCHVAASARFAGLIGASEVTGDRRRRAVRGYRSASYLHQTAN